MKRKLTIVILVVAVLSCLATLVACQHKCTFGEWQTVKEATCTEQGLKERYCTDSSCNKKEEEKIPVNENNHNLQPVDGVDSTCTTEGTVAHQHCTLCGKNFDGNKNEITEVTIPTDSTKHNLQPVSKVDATCESDGTVEHNHCTLCGKDFDTDGDAKNYVSTCSACSETKSENAGSEQFPLLVRNEDELKNVVNSAAESSYIKLTQNITITAKMYASVLRLPDNGTLDLGENTVTVKNNGGFLVEGTNVTLQNGKIVTDYEDPKEGYAVFIGDEGENNSVTVKNLQTKGGFNVYNCNATFYDCTVDASEHTYYALWADQHSTITVESGEYYGGEIACIHSTANEDPESTGYIVLNGGSFYGKVIATYCTTINGGTFDSDIVLTVVDSNNIHIHAKLIVNKDINESLNIVVGSATYEIVTSRDANENFIYETKLKEASN